MYRGLLAFLFVVTSASSVTFNKDLAPIVFEHCAPCHHDGGIGPFPLISYSDVAKHAAQLVAVTNTRYMPPWPPAHGFGEFKGDRSLSNQQIQLFADWLKQSKPEGNLADLPAAPNYSSEWQLGPPDLILKMDKPFMLPADGSDVFRNFILPSNVKQPRYVRGFELRMTNPRVVHHANVVLDRTQALRRRDGSDGQPGFPGMDVITEAAANNFDPDSHFLFYKPGSVLRPEPDDMAWRLDPSTDLVINLHLQPTGKPESVQAEVGLYFTDRVPTRKPMLVQLEHDSALRIPAGSTTFSVTDSLVLPVDVDLLAVYPHAHYIGKTFDAWATTHDGKRIPLLRILDWDINWQAVYEYKNPVALPKGTRLEMRITYDNSEHNPRNPNHPSRLVTFGDRSRDEMGHVWFQLLARNTDASGDGRLAIQEAVMRRRLEKYPGDFLAHYNLAALLQGEEKLDEAIALYKTALTEEPKNATAHNSFATALMGQGDVTGAIEELKTAIACDPDYTSAHFNLGRALAGSGKLPQSITEFEAVLDKHPDDAAANAALGTVEYKLKAYKSSLRHLKAATSLNPTDADLQANLGTVLAITGDLPGARDAFETALKINPDQVTARTNLQIVLSKLSQR
jgi:tetratricopeptide (TPR) repeat protein